MHISRFVNEKIRKVNEGQIEDNNAKYWTRLQSPGRVRRSHVRHPRAVRTSPPEQNNTAILRSVSSRLHIILQTTGNVVIMPVSLSYENEDVARMDEFVTERGEFSDGEGFVVVFWLMGSQ